MYWIKEKGLEAFLKKLSKVEWIDFWFSISQRREVFEELKEVEEMFKRFIELKETAFVLGIQKSETCFNHIELIIVKSASYYIESKYNIRLQLEYPDRECQKYFKNAEPLPISILLKECQKILDQIPTNLKP